MKEGLLLVGIFITVMGLALILGPLIFDKIPKLPGDILIKKDNFTFYFPIATSILISAILTFILNVVIKCGR